MEFARAREFVLGAYHDLPNVLLTGSLLFGSITGYRPLLWMAVGLLFLNTPITYLAQIGLSKIPLMAPYIQVERSGRCATYSDTSIASNTGFNNAGPPSSLSIMDQNAPTWWMTSAFFFITFTLWNAIAVLFSESNPNATMDQKNNRRAYCLSVIAISCIFIFLAASRLMSGCETGIGALLGVLIGGSLALIYWKVLNACGSGLVPDVLQIIGNSAPETSGIVTPVICT